MRAKAASAWTGPRARDSVLVLAVAVMATACSSKVPTTPNETGTPPAPAAKPAAGNSGLATCDSHGARPAPSAVVEAFATGGRVDSALKNNLSLARDAVGVPASLGAAERDAATIRPVVTELQSGFLDVPAWSKRTVDDVVAPALAGCARSEGQVVARLLNELDSRNNMAATEKAPARQAIDDLDGSVAKVDPLTKAFATVFSVDSPWPRRPQSNTFAQSEAAIAELSTRIDQPTQNALAAVVVGMAKAEAWRLDAAKSLGQELDYARLAKLMASRTLSPTEARRFDYSAMGRAGVALAGAVERLQAHLVAHPLPDTLDFRLATPLGEVVLKGGSGADTYALAAPAIVVDQGGNDTYNGVIAGPGLESVPLSVAIDISGDDTYAGGETTATQGAGVLSFGFLLDAAGNDSYQASDLAQGAGFLGVGALFDTAGNDSHRARSYAQGAGQFGLGVAADLGGKDSWALTSYGQGYGEVRSAGLLLDAEGDDTYEANDTDIINPSAQSPDHNTSMAQGAGFGPRPGGRDNMGGGIGILADLSGNDAYSCGVFCQGSGHFFSQGILYDGAGNDDYRGFWYVQGAAAHFALGVLIEDGGNDSYRTGSRASRGLGHDASAGFLLEAGGDDSYEMTPLTNGASSNHGYGFFVDLAGADAYTAEEIEDGWFGQSSADGDYANYTGRTGLGALGLFMDLAGQDEYRGVQSLVKNGATWKLPGIRTPPQHLGFGQDSG